MWLTWISTLWRLLPKSERRRSSLRSACDAVRLNPTSKSALCSVPR